MVIKELVGLGKTIFEERYQYPGEKTWGDRSKVIAKHISSAERDDEKEKWEKKFHEIISSGDFIPGGRIIYGSGRNGGRHNLLNCYVLDPDDSVESIGKCISDTYKISCAGGGIGFNFSKIRPLGDHIQNIANSAPGSVSVMRMINEIGNHVRAGKNRRTALIAILNVTHPDLLEFLGVKLDQGQLENFNISVAITDRFIEACENDEEWYFVFNNKKYYVYSIEIKTPGYQEGKVKTYRTVDVNVVAWDEADAIARAKQHKLLTGEDTFKCLGKVEIKARDIWDRLWANACKSGDPGIFNIDLANSYTNTYYFESLQSTNPCGEIPLPAYGNCCLGHLNLSNMVEDGEVDWSKLARTVRAGIRFLDNVLSVNYFPIPECKSVSQKSRRVGLGVIGLHYMLLKLGIQYGSEDSLEFIDRLFETIRNEAYKASIYLARDKGAFPEFNSKLYLKSDYSKSLPPRIRMMIKEHGIRNAVMLTVAPTGTISMVHGVSSGIEPIFAPIYKRRYRKGTAWAEEVCFDPLFRKYLDEGKSIDAFVGAYDITPKDHLRVQATIQKYIDSSISKTINLPENFEEGSFGDLVLAFIPYLKGLTIYRAGSKGMEPLEAIPTTPDNIKKYAAVDAYNEVQQADFCSLTGGQCD